MYIDKVDPLPKSRLSVNELIELSQREFFKVGINERYKNVGSLKYLGFKYTLHKNNKGNLVLYVNLFFYMKGANFQLYKTKEGTKKGKRHPRETYLLVAKFPYRRNVKNMKRLYDVPIQIFSSDPSFKYYFAYALNRMNAVVTDDPELVKWLGKALTKPPKKTNPDMMVQLTKHFYKFFKFIANERPKKYLDDKYQIKSDVRIINKNA